MVDYSDYVVPEAIVDQLKRMTTSLNRTHPVVVSAFVRNKRPMVSVLIEMYTIFDCYHTVPDCVPRFNANIFETPFDNDEMVRYIDLIELAQCTHLE